MVNMKTDYRVICCVAVLLGCAVVNCLENLPKDFRETNKIDEYWPEEDDIDVNDILRKTNELDPKLHRSKNLKDTVFMPEKLLDGGDDGDTGDDGGEKECPEGQEKKGEVCTATCKENGDDCKNGAICKKNGEPFFCECKKGTEGDFCDIVTDCKDTEKYKECRGEKGTCAYNVKNEKAECTCTGNKELNDEKNFCEDDFCKIKCNVLTGENNDEVDCVGNRFIKEETKCNCKDEVMEFHEEQKKCQTACTMDGKECKNGGMCTKIGEDNFCVCLKGTKGDLCNIIEDCQDTGIYAQCKGDKGTCGYNIPNQKAECTCTEKKSLNDAKEFCVDDFCKIKCNVLTGESNDEVDCAGNRFVEEETKCNCKNNVLKFHEGEKKCKATCTMDGKECKNGGACTKIGEDHFCVCLKGTKGDFCNIIEDCQETGIYAQCKGDKGTCGYDIPNEKAVCTCEGKKVLNDAEGICVDCECGDKSTGCTFKDGTKTCECITNFADDDGTCAATCTMEGTECKNGATCAPKGEFHFCACQAGTKGDYCETVIDCQGNGKYAKCSGDKGTCDYDITKKKAECTCEGNKKLNDVKGFCEVCDCGQNAKDCKYDNGVKKCDCNANFADKDGLCAADFCQTKCNVLSGDSNEEVTCIGDRFDSEKTECKCKVNNMRFDLNERKCKADYCQIKCNVLSGDSNDEVTCTGDRFTSDKTICTCKNDNLKFDMVERKCKTPCQIEGSTCTNGANCTQRGENHFCACLSGTEGSNCEIVKECNVDGKYALCKEENGTCQYHVESEEAECVCSANKKVNDLTSICEECVCGVNTEPCKFEDGNKTCNCLPKFALMEGTCTACDCGENAISCTFEGKEKKCGCKPNFAQKNGTCTATCTKGGTDCKNGGTCTESAGDHFCVCLEGTEGSMCEVVKDCQPKGKYAECKGDKGTCGFNSESKKSECTCSASKKLNDKKNYCEECKCGVNMDPCKFVDGEKVCSCKKNFALKNKICTACQCGTDEESSGCKFEEETKECYCQKNYKEKEGKCLKDYCQINCHISDDHSNKEVVCEGDEFNSTGVVCKCHDETYKFDNVDKKCRTECKKDGSDCKNGATCEQRGTAHFCACKSGTEGDTCTVVKDCNPKGKYEKCKNENGNCAYDTEKAKAVCNCPKNKKVNEEKGYCEVSFCVDGGCKGSECKFDEEKQTAYCVCGKGTYYDYFSQGCKSPDKCLLKKTPCGENERCVDGKCLCKEKYEREKDGAPCKPKLCKPDPCFPGANCTEGTGACYCAEGKIFTGSACVEKCVLSGFKEKCDCPSGMKRDKDKKCVPSTDSQKACDKDCGYGYCVDNKCKCVTGATSMVVEKGKNATCVLSTVVCASGKLTSDYSKCDCTGKYKLSTKNGKSCELVTCDDEAAKTDCKSKGASCVMKWKGKPEYDCVCQDGYVLDTERNICTDPSSLQRNIATCLGQDKFCYNSESVKNKLTGDCTCPPPFKGTKCAETDENFWLISNIPVMKQAYEMQGDIDYVLLNARLIQSLRVLFSGSLFEYGYLNDYVVEGGIIKCSVWVHFKKAPGEELKRAIYQAQSFPEGTCDDCRTDMYVWPPALVVNKDDMSKVEYSNLTVCSDVIKNKLCGKEAKCKDNKCFCPRGYRTLEYTVRNMGQANIQRCEPTSNVDFNECQQGTHECSANTTCVKTPGSYYCKCNKGYVKDTENDRNPCFDMCSKSPCDKGSCSMKDGSFNCQCEPGYGGSRCDSPDTNFAAAKKSTVIVGAVLGTILIVGLIAFLVYYKKVKKSSYSEDFTPAPRSSHAAEMMERRPMRGVVNKSYE